MLSSPCHGHWDEVRVGNDLGLGHREDVPIFSGKGGSPWENCLSEEAETGFPGVGQKEQRDSGRTGPGMFEKDESSGVCYAGCWGLVGHPQRPRCQAGEPGHSCLCRGLRTYPNSSHLSIRSLMAGTCTKSDHSVTHEACVSARRTHPQHAGNPRPLQSRWISAMISEYLRKSSCH